MSEVIKSHESREQENDVFEVWQEALEDVEFAGDKASEDESEAASIGEELYSKEYREGVNVPQCDLFMKRRAVIAERFPALKPMSQEEEKKYLGDEEFRETKKRAIEEVPKDIRDEYDLLGTMVGRMEDGIRVGRSRSSNPEPTLTSREIKSEDGSFIVTEWKAEETETDLARLHELHEKNSQSIDFSHENDVDIDSIPEDLQNNIERLEQDIAALETASAEDFEPVAGKRPKTAKIYDQILGLSKTGNLSYATRKKLNGLRNAFERQYIMAEDGAKLRQIDAGIAELQSEKAEIVARQTKYDNAGFVGKMFQRLVHSKRMREDQDRLDTIDSRTGVLRGQASKITELKQARGF